MGISDSVRSATNSPQKGAHHVYTHLTENERYVISHLKIADFPLRETSFREYGDLH